MWTRGDIMLRLLLSNRLIFWCFFCGDIVDPHEDFPSAVDIDDEAEADDRTGGQGGDPESNKKYVNARVYYAYKLQIRREEFNVLFHGGRLFQQWLIDMYLKVESMRLNWYSRPAHQKIIRADFYQITTFSKLVISSKCMNK
ncbi:hypothetical protein EJB05_42530, partial [Eragrostis curvula]